MRRNFAEVKILCRYAVWVKFHAAVSKQSKILKSRLSGRVKICAEAVSGAELSQRQRDQVKFYKSAKQAVSQQKWHCPSQASCVSSGRVKDKIFHGDGKVQQCAARGT